MKRILLAVIFLATGALSDHHLAAQEGSSDNPLDVAEGFFGSEPATETESAPAEAESGAGENEPEKAGGPPAGEPASTATESPPENVEENEPDAVAEMDDLLPRFVPEDNGAESEKKPRKTGERIEPIDGFEQARQRARLEERPLLVVLGAEWCSWCRKLEKELATEQADTILGQWIVAEVDVDDEPAVAEEFDARALPALRVVDAAEETVASHTGYMPLDQLQGWLDEQIEQADPVLQRVLLESDPPTQQEVAELAQLLCRRSADLRASASQRLVAHRSVAAPAVVDLLRTGPLSGQLSALSVLEAWGAPTDGLDPWDPETLDEPSLQPLLTWLRDIPSRPEAEPEATRPAAASAEAAGRLVREMIEAPASRRKELAAQAIALGPPAAAEVRRLLAAGEESFSDQQREWLRSVHYGVLAGSATRLDSPGLLRALAQLDAPTHRAAAEKLLKQATSQDQPLVDALTKDEDPLVRELAVMALGRIGALGSGDRLQRLLADESPSVRTAVLRELAEDPTTEITGQLVDYLETESDEDLLVYATKTLGQLHESEQAGQALADLMDDSRWRVRAAALDAVLQFFENQPSFVGFGDRGRVVSEPIAEAVLARLDDEDAFVRERAVEVLPHILSDATAERIAEFFLDDLQRLDRALDSVGEHEAEQKFQPLIDLSQQWLDGADESRIVDAAVLLSRASPTHLRYQLDELLQSERQRLRIAALQAVLPAISEFRKEKIEDEVARWRSRYGRDAKRELDAMALIRPVPDAFAPYQPPPAKRPEQKVADDDAAESNSAADDDSSIDAAANFFGPKPAAEAASEVAERDQIASVVESEPSKDDADSGDRRSVLGIAASLFGFSSADSAEQEAEKDPEAPEQTEAAALEPEQVGLGSDWMQRWRQHHRSIKRSTWIRKIEPIVEKLTGAEDPRERAWAQTAHLVLGNTDQVDALLGTLEVEEAVEDYPSLEAILSWLPPEPTLALIRRQQKAAPGFSDERWWQTLQAVTFDNQPLAEYLLAEVTAGSVDEPKALSSVAEHLVRALIGEKGYRELHMLSSDQLDIDEADSLSEIKARKLVPGQLQAARWLMQKYSEAETNQEQTVLLTALATISRRHGVAEALAVLDRAAEDTLLVRVAARLAMTDLTSLASDRAVVLLDHPVPTVAREALRRLATINYRSGASDDALETPYVWEARARLLGLQSTERPLPSEPLRRIKAGPDPEAAAIASALLLALGEPLDVAEISRQLTGLEDSLVLLTAALARAERTDDEAMGIYEKCVASADYSQTGAVRLALSKLPREKVKPLLNQLSDETGFFSID